MDTALKSLSERFKNIGIFIKNPEKPEHLKLHDDLQIKLPVGSKSDIDGYMLCDELICLKHFLPDDNVGTPEYILSFIKDRKIQELYPNVWKGCEYC